MHVFAYPAHYYARFQVLVLPDPKEELNPLLELCGFAPMDAVQMRDVISEMGDTPVDFRPWDRSHAPSVRWLRKKKVYSLMHQDEAAQEMQRIVSDRRLRESVERMLIGNVSHQEISARLRKKGYAIGESAIADYRHYFWNTEIMGAADWAEYFRSDSQGRTRNLRSQYEAARVSGPKFALYRSGLEVEVDRRAVLGELQNELYFTFQEVKALPASEKKVEMLSALVRSLVRLDERLEEGEGALADVLKKFEKFRVASDSSKIPLMTDIAPTGTISDKSKRQLATSKERDN